MDRKIFTINGRNLNAFNDILRGGFGSFELGEKITLIFSKTKYVKKQLGESFLKKIVNIINTHEHIELILK